MSELTHLIVEVSSGDPGDSQTITANARVFSTGSRGFGYYGKLLVAGKKYQVSLNIVEVGSKPQK